MLQQDLHIHTIFSVGDGSVVPEQTRALVASVKHAKILGISDHFESITTKNYDEYRDAVVGHNLRLGTEVDGHASVDEATELDFEYYIYHCWDKNADYKAIDKLLDTGKPLIIAHPYTLGTNLSKIPVDCYVEINNRYIWRVDWRNFLKEHVKRFNFVISSDAHQPNWLSQTVAQFVAKEMRIKETILF